LAGLKLAAVIMSIGSTLNW